MRPVVLYGVVRILLFAAALVVFLIVVRNPYVSAVLAAVVAFCIAYIAFAPLRRASAEALAARRRLDGEGDHVASAHGDDEDAEDAAAPPADPR
ncbi:DUF4229 domain-containing protein [Galbitalea sp. SE-J8]|uniref:DUF4229 domain-containing protein n=1 Tax=Galbitalea sp. SE-J8 TaxID=3054952 RepID=UPI00259CAA5D|nr:DUF4229 domain-containing protein [Galbitalea sp. SE-J8]MDM4762406.1 DUF4229 domain-containing protein [Galbitalea sp. SE-J8]